MLARRNYSSGYIRQRTEGRRSIDRSAAIRQENINPSGLSRTLRFQPIVVGENFTIYPTRFSPPPSSWDTETLVDEPTVPDPRDYSELAPPQVSEVNARGRVTSLRLRPGQPLALIVYGNGRWILQPNPRPRADTETYNSGSLAQQALVAILERQPPANTTTNQVEGAGGERAEARNGRRADRPCAAVPGGDGVLLRSAEDAAI